MAAVIDIGRVCVKVAGREGGRKCIVVDIINGNYVLITGPKDMTGVRRRRANVNHLEPMEYKIDVRKGAADGEVMEAIRKAGLEDLMMKKIKPALR